MWPPIERFIKTKGTYPVVLYDEIQDDWKPHEKSMIFGYLADMVATIPSWIAMEVTKNELDVAPTEARR